MPDCYTHVYNAAQAQIISGQLVACRPAFIAGANGPDLFSMYQFYKQRPMYDLPSYNKKIHKDTPGAFLNILCAMSTTPAQQSYTMGFLTHYATDCTLHPFIDAMGEQGLFSGRAGMLHFEASMDSTLFYQDYGNAFVPLYAGTPILRGEALQEVAKLLQDVVRIVYKSHIPADAFAGAFEDNLNIRTMLTSDNKRVYAKLRSTGTIKSGEKIRELVVNKIPPVPVMPDLPTTWKNPHTGEEMFLSFDQLLALAQQTGAACIVAAMQYWLGEIDERHLAKILGDNDYYTGLPYQRATPANPPGKESHHG